MDSANESNEIEINRDAEEGGEAIIDTEDDGDDDEPLEATRETQWVTATTRAGRISRLPARYRNEINAAALNSLAGRNYYELLIEEDEDDEDDNELACVGAGLGGGFENTNELHAMNYKAVLERCTDGEALTDGEQTRYRSGVGELLHMMRWSRPEIYNAVRELLQFMTIGASNIHMKAMERVMSYCLTTRNRGLLIEPTLECVSESVTVQILKA